MTLNEMNHRASKLLIVACVVLAALLMVVYCFVRQTPIFVTFAIVSVVLAVLGCFLYLSTKEKIEEEKKHPPEWRQARKLPVPVEYREVRGEKEKIHTREGVLYAYSGADFIIRGVDGEEYPIKKYIFEKTYEEL